MFSLLCCEHSPRVLIHNDMTDRNFVCFLGLKCYFCLHSVFELAVHFDWSVARWRLVSFCSSLSLKGIGFLIYFVLIKMNISEPSRLKLILFPELLMKSCELRIKMYKIDVNAQSQFRPWLNLHQNTFSLFRLPLKWKTRCNSCNDGVIT